MASELERGVPSVLTVDLTADTIALSPPLIISENEIDTLFGEKVVMRILDRSKLALDFVTLDRIRGAVDANTFFQMKPGTFSVQAAKINLQGNVAVGANTSAVSVGRPAGADGATGECGGVSTRPGSEPGGEPYPLSRVDETPV